MGDESVDIASAAPRILVIPSWYPTSEHPTGGIFVAQQVQAMRSQGIDVAVLFDAEQYLRPGPVIEREDGVLTVRTGWPPGRSNGMIARRLGTASRMLAVRLPAYRRRIIEAADLLLERGFRPDVIHVHALWHAGAAAAVVADHLGIPFVVTEHSEEYARATERRLVRTPGVVPLVLRPLARRAAAYIAVSQGLADRLEELRLADHIRVIPNVVCARVPREIPSREPHRILHVSQLGPAKNIPLLLRAVHRLREARQDFVLEIGGDSAFRPDVESLAHDLGLADVSVRFLGRLTPAQVQSALDDCAFTVLSSLHENSSVFAAESLMAGRSLLTTACGGHVEYLDPTLGRVVANDDVEALAEGLDWMLDHFSEFDPAHLSEFARMHFSEEAVVSQLLAVYQEVLRA